MNPLSRLFSYILLSISILLSHELPILVLHILLTLLLVLYKRQFWNKWKRQTRPYWIYLPLSGMIFFIISIFISAKPLDAIILDVILATIRLSATVSIMTLYIIESQSHDTLLAVRGVMFSSGIKYQWLDRLLLYLEITIRFFPSIKEHWSLTEKSQKALNIKVQKSTLKRITSIAKSIPDFLIINLQKTEYIVQSMLMRGYGNNSRRSVYPHIKFKLFDSMISMATLFFVIGVHNFV